MTTYESDIKSIFSNEEVIFGTLSDFTTLEKLNKNASHTEQIKELKFDSDSCSFVVDGFGKMGFRIVDREAFKTIKLESEGAPIKINIWVQLKSICENETAMKITLKADMPMMIKMMVDNKLKDGLNRVANLLADGLNSTPRT